MADALWGKSFPIVVLAEADFRRIQTGDRVTVQRDGTVLVEPASAAQPAPAPAGRETPAG